MLTIDEILSRLVELLSQEGETYYARVLEIRRLQFVKAPGEAERRDVAIDILRMYGGMGSFNDLVLLDGVRTPSGSNRRLNSLRNALYEAASRLATTR